MDGIDALFNFLFAALGVSLLAAWPGIYLLWAKELRGRAVFASSIQVLRWITWLLLLALISFGTVYVLGYVIAVVRLT
jgi:hypothetical protein